MIERFGINYHTFSRIGGQGDIEVPNHLAGKLESPDEYATLVNRIKLFTQIGGRSVFDEKRTLEAMADIISHSPLIAHGMSLDNPKLYVRGSSRENLVYSPLEKGIVLEAAGIDYVVGLKYAAAYVKRAGICASKKLEDAIKKGQVGTFRFNDDRSLLKNANLKKSVIYLVAEINGLKK